MQDIKHWHQGPSQASTAPPMIVTLSSPTKSIEGWHTAGERLLCRLLLPPLTDGQNVCTTGAHGDDQGAAHGMEPPCIQCRTTWCQECPPADLVPAEPTCWHRRSARMGSLYSRLASGLPTPGSTRHLLHEMSNKACSDEINYNRRRVTEPQALSKRSKVSAPLGNAGAAHGHGDDQDAAHVDPPQTNLVPGVSTCRLESNGC